MLSYRPMLALPLNEARRKLLQVFPTALPTWRSTQWRKEPLALAAELEALQKAVSDPDQLRLIAVALVCVLVLYKDDVELWTLPRVNLLQRAISGLLSRWSGEKLHKQKSRKLKQRDDELKKRAAAHAERKPRAKASQIANLLATATVREDFRRLQLLSPPKSAETIRKIIAAAVKAKRFSASNKADATPQT